MSEIATIRNQQLAARQENFDRDRVELIKRTYCKGASNDELALFINTCQRLNLSPEARQIFAVKRYDSQLRREVMSLQISIDGLRLVAERTGKYAGQLGPYWTDGTTQQNPKTGAQEFVWFDAWISDEYPVASKVGVVRKGFIEPVWGVARWKSYVQTKRDGTPNSMWNKMPDIMLAKCCEALALRKAFPHDLSGMYTDVEMAQEEPIRVTPDRPAVHVTNEERTDRMVRKFMALDPTVDKMTVIERLEEECEGVDIGSFDAPQFKRCAALFKELEAKKKAMSGSEEKPEVEPDPIPEAAEKK